MTDTGEGLRARPSPHVRPPRRWESGPPPFVVAVGSGRPAKLRGVAAALRRIHPTLPLVVEHRDGTEERIDPRVPSRLAGLRGRIVVRAWPTELQDRGIGVDAEPVGYEETRRCALKRLDCMKREHPWTAVNGLVVIESGRLPRGEASERSPREPLDAVRDMRDDVAVIAIEGRDGRQQVFYSAGTWIPIIVSARGEATDPIDAARRKREERERRRREGGPPWTAEDQAQIESGWHVREALGVDHDRSGRSWQSYVGSATPRERQIEEAIVRNWDPTLIDPRLPLGRTVEEEHDRADPRGLGL